MLKIKIFTFNSFQVNTYLLYNDTLECAIVDAACYSPKEHEQLRHFISNENLKPVILLNTHCHIDHILGNNYVYDTWGLKPVMHPDSTNFLNAALGYAETYGFKVSKPVMPEQFLAEGDTVSFGNNILKVLETPGHAAGSICFHNEAQKFVIVGDVLFSNSIGRTDLPTGNYDLLISSIRKKLFSLPDETTVYCGHGPSTTIGYEKTHNPFL